MSKTREMRDVDTRDVMRAFGMTMVVANHAFAASLHGGLNLLLLLSGMAFAHLCFGTRGDGPILQKLARFARPLAVWSVVFCLFWFAVFGRVELAELLMLSNWITTERVSKFPIWYTQVLLQILLVLALLLSWPGLLAWLRRCAIRVSLSWLFVTVAGAGAAQIMVNTDHLADKLPHLHAWNFVLGWVVWAVLYARIPTALDRLVLTVLVLPLLFFMFVGLDAPGGAARIWIALPPLLLLIWCPRLSLPSAIAHPILLIGQATLFLFFLHYPFILAVRNVLGTWVNQGALEVLQFAAGLVGPVLIWAMVTAGQRALAQTRLRQSKAPYFWLRPRRATAT